jgi:hypothetical protein
LVSGAFSSPILDRSRKIAAPKCKAALWSLVQSLTSEFSGRLRKHFIMMLFELRPTPHLPSDKSNPLVRLTKIFNKQIEKRRYVLAK